jgi:hypothetical protein
MIRVEGQDSLGPRVGKIILGIRPTATEQGLKCIVVDLRSKSWGPVLWHTGATVHGRKGTCVATGADDIIYGCKLHIH